MLTTWLAAKFGPTFRVNSTAATATSTRATIIPPVGLREALFILSIDRDFVQPNSGQLYFKQGDFSNHVYVPALHEYSPALPDISSDSIILFPDVQYPLLMDGNSDRDFIIQAVDGGSIRLKLTLASVIASWTLKFDVSGD